MRLLIAGVTEEQGSLCGDTDRDSGLVGVWVCPGEVWEGGQVQAVPAGHWEDKLVVGGVHADEQP